MKLLKLVCFKCSRPMSLKVMSDINDLVIAAIPPCVCYSPITPTGNIEYTGNVIDINKYRKK